MKEAKIVGLGSYLPSFNISNDQLAEIVDTSDKWIYQRTGIKHRRIAATESVADMATKAGVEALKSAKLLPEDIDLILVATSSPDTIMPSTACIVQKNIHASKAMCFDLTAACSGFVYGMDVVHQFIKTGSKKNILLIGAEKLSQLVDWTDRGTCVLFGDGAGASVIQAGDQKKVYDTINRSIGDLHHVLRAPLNHHDTPYYKQDSHPYLQMDGREVFQFAVRKVPEIIQEVLDKNKIVIEEIDYFVLHQANARIIQKVAKRLKVPLEKFFMNMDRYGNTSAASIPIALKELADQVDLRGKKVLFAGFGAGLTYGAGVVEL